MLMNATQNEPIIRNRAPYMGLNFNHGFSIIVKEFSIDESIILTQEQLLQIGY